METELTKTLKKLTHYFKPIMHTKMRTLRYADEVWTPTGIVDSIRFEDIPTKELNDCRKLKHNEPCKLGQKEVGEYCKGCVFYQHAVLETGICVTCFEVKITFEDFKSPHGHNFCGNRNYYVVPKELAPKIVDLVPDDIGIITYHGHNYMRVDKECKFKEITEELKCRLLYDGLKKWCDGSQSIK